MMDNPFFINLPVVHSSASSTATTVNGGGAVETSTGDVAETSTGDAAGVSTAGILGIGGFMRGLRFNN